MQSLANMQQQQTGVAEARQPKNLMQMLGDDKTKKQIAALVGSVMTPDRMVALTINAVRKNPKLGACEPLSVIGSVMAAAGLGLELNTPSQHAWLIPYDKRGKLPNGQWGVIGVECQMMIGYRGFVELMYRSHAIERVEAEAIHANDVFEHMQGSNAFIKFQKKLTNRGPLIGAYALVKLKNGAEVALVLPLEEIHKSRDASDTYTSLLNKVAEARNDAERAKAQKKLDETPWVKDEDEMAMKTALRRIVKRLPLSSNDKLTLAAAIDDAPVNMRAMADDKVAGEVFEHGVDVPVYAPEDEEPALEHNPGEVIPQEASQAAKQAVPADEVIKQKVEKATQPVIDAAASKAAGEQITTEPAEVLQDNLPSANVSESQASGVTQAGLLDMVAKAKTEQELERIDGLVEQLPPEEQPPVTKAIRSRTRALQPQQQGFSLG